MENFLPTYKINDTIHYENNCLYLHTWSLDLEDYSISQYIQNIVSDETVIDSKIFLLVAEEYEIGNNFEQILTLSLKQKLKEKRLEIHFLFGGACIDFYSDTNFGYHDPENNLFVHLWPTFWITQTLNLTFRQNLDYYFFTEQIELKKTTIVYPFITMNNVGKYNRCLLIDLLSKNNLIDIGAVSWHNFSIDASYNWRWTTPEQSVRVLSDSERYLRNKHLNQFIPPTEFSQSFMSLISETVDRTIFLTEKTATPLLFKQPFLVQGAVGFHRYLESLGFKLYDEIFDYTFDQIDDIEQRTQLLLDNILRIRDKNLLELYQIIKPKLDYNQQRVFEIAKNSDFVPMVVKSISNIKERYQFDDIGFLNEDL
jgi:hypothetical protein